MRLKPKVVVAGGVCNKSSREGVKPAIIVLHSTESANIPGPGDLQSVWHWFNNPSADASSHVITDAEGQSARCVADEDKAWTCAGFNSVSLNIEQIGYAAQGQWVDAEIDETARWIAKWSIKHGIPIERGKVVGSAVVKAGILLHSELGSIGGGHSDPGGAYPLGRVIERAKSIRKQLRK